MPVWLRHSRYSIRRRPSKSLWRIDDRLDALYADLNREEKFGATQAPKGYYRDSAAA